MPNEGENEVQSSKFNSKNSKPGDPITGWKPMPLSPLQLEILFEA
jgi:hypothetical protein